MLPYIVQSTAIIRKFTLDNIKDLSEEHLLAIPKGFGNNIIWNLGHTLTSHQLLTYSMSGLPLNIPPHYVSMYRKGSRPSEWTQAPDIREIKELLASTLAIFEDDYRAGRFKDYKEYTTSMGITLSTVEHAASMNYGHEMQHLGIMQSLKKLVLQGQSLQ